MIIARFLLTMLFIGLFAAMVYAGGTYHIDRDEYGLYISIDKDGEYYINPNDFDVSIKPGMNGKYNIKQGENGTYINTDKIGNIYIKPGNLEKSRKETSKAWGIRRKAEEPLFEDKKSFQRNIEKIEIGDKKRDVIRKMGYPDLTESVNQPQIDVFTPGGVIVGIYPFMEEWTYFGPDITAVVIFQDGQVIQKP
ncbi:MAG: hypothetical protein U9N83_11820 [Thermodesulfobacteriota bacterium]|nr:hypothetical protein [Thermodesulfobacteriota bacterium]